VKHYPAYIKDNWLKKTFPLKPLDEHIHAAAQWLMHAQSQAADGGVPHCFDVKKKRWWPSYPETTGYIIPTLFDYGNEYKVASAIEAAIRMTQWESDIQLEDGGVMAGHMGAEVITPTIFNTGQVLFGWARAYEETHEQSFYESLRRASDWLVEAMDEDGAWRKYASPFAPGEVKVYNTRCAFGLARSYQVIGDHKYLEAAIKNIDWALTMAKPNGWLIKNCLTLNPQSLTHTIAYAMRGILEVGAFTENQNFIDFAIQMAQKMMVLQRDDGAFPGRVDEHWTSKHQWTCVTGNSQLAINFFRLFEITGNKEFLFSAVGANRFNRSIQDTETENSNIFGAMKGSHPINAEYISYRYPNWAAKFFIDALLLEKKLANSQ